MMPLLKAIGLAILFKLARAGNLAICRGQPSRSGCSPRCRRRTTVLSIVLKKQAFWLSMPFLSCSASWVRQRSSRDGARLSAG
jgi:hypothetical protein